MQVAAIVALAFTSVQATVSPQQELSGALRAQRLERRYHELAVSGDRATLSEEWRADPDRVFQLIHADLEKSVSLIEQARTAGQEPDASVVAMLQARARFGAEVADEAFGTAIFTDCAVAFASWNATEQAQFRSREAAIRRAIVEGNAGKHESALAAAVECEELALSLGDWWGAAMGANQRGEALLSLGRHQEAVAAYSKAVLIFHDLRLLGGEYLNLLHLTDALNAAGLRERERHVLERARALAEALGNGGHSGLSERLQRVNPGLQVPNVISNLFVANVEKAKMDIVQIDNACTEYATQNQMKYPESIQQLVTPDDKGYTYLKKETVPLDPWGNEYQYEPPGGGSPYPTITCFGSDGVPGGEADAKDMTNHQIRNGEL